MSSLLKPLLCSSWLVPMVLLGKGFYVSLCNMWINIGIVQKGDAGLCSSLISLVLTSFVFSSSASMKNINTSNFYINHLMLRLDLISDVLIGLRICVYRKKLSEVYRALMIKTAMCLTYIIIQPTLRIITGSSAARSLIYVLCLSVSRINALALSYFPREFCTIILLRSDRVHTS